jgi:hypothetical protein
MPEVIPFGKYKGQPVEVLDSDPQYRNWLSEQAWVRERFPNLHTVIINHHGEPTETPEHNALQARFLSRTFVRCFAQWVADEYGCEVLECGDPRFEVEAVDVQLVVKWRMPKNGVEDREHWLIECKPVLSDDYPEVIRKFRALKPRDTWWSRKVLLIERFASAVVTLDQLRRMFPDLVIVTFDEIATAAIDRVNNP